ncbi:MAG: hypothetical protein CVV24_15635 [Ignavibacteriae bacterium HGW-Ignavibacteriae-3]|nr:MAG: hypothetical protein CVV24_15635 [Ignavibacteriae bacterium HGW-Ignavibacteriae-3]
MLVLTMTNLILFTFLMNEMQLVVHEEVSNTALPIAEAGIEQAKVWLMQSSHPGSNVLPHIIEGNIGDGSYRAVIIGTVTPRSSGYIRYKVKSVGNATTGNREISRKIIAEFQTESFSRFFYFTDSERAPDYTPYTIVWFWKNDRIRGPAHTNTDDSASHGFYIYRTPTEHPVFDSFTSSRGLKVYDYNDGEIAAPAEVFPGGFSGGEKNIDMPSDAEYLKSAAQDKGIYLQGTTTIELLSTGQIKYTNDGITNTVAVPSNGAFYVDNGNITSLKGTLTGQLTIGANGDIYITDNILYNVDPVENPNSTDKLGLVSEGNIYIHQDAPDTLTIYACIMALNTAFHNLSYDSVFKGTLKVYGGIIQKRRGIIGLINTSTGDKEYGYTKDYYYDSRLEQSPPPFFPPTGKYVIASWRESRT